jgi:cytochrome b6-f complex iron-sulfur subunit
MMTALVLATAAAGLLALAFWWIRRSHMAAYVVAAPRELRSMPACDVGQQLLMASATEAPTAADTPGGAGPQAGGAPARRQKRRGPTRRQFLRNMQGIAFLGTITGFAVASLTFLWPDLRGGFGARLSAGSEEELLGYIRTNREPFEFPAGRTYFVEYQADLDREGQYDQLTDGGQARVMALYWRCVHLGCKVPWCQSSQWLECPCHGSRYNRWGEWQGGPAPRGLDRFQVEVVNGEVFVDTGQLITGPSRQTPALDQPPEGPTCT